MGPILCTLLLLSSLSRLYRFLCLAASCSPLPISSLPSTAILSLICLLFALTHLIFPIDRHLVTHLPPFRLYPPHLSHRPPSCHSSASCSPLPTSYFPSTAILSLICLLFASTHLIFPIDRHLVTHLPPVRLYPPHLSHRPPSCHSSASCSPLPTSSFPSTAILSLICLLFASTHLIFPIDRHLVTHLPPVRLYPPHLSHRPPSCHSSTSCSPLPTSSFPPDILQQ